MSQRTDRLFSENRIIKVNAHALPVSGRQSDDYTEVHEIPLDRLLPGYSPRLEGENPEHVQLLAETQRDLPPILVHRSSMRVIDGMHRLHAARLRRDRAINVRFFDGDEREAFIAAVKANVAHGLPLTLADREAAAIRIIGIEPNASDRSIALITGLAASTIAVIRERIRTDDDGKLARIGRDGRVRPLNSADARRVASEIIAKHPDASLREIAKIAGISPATVLDVRKRIARGDDPVPTKLRPVRERPHRSNKKLPNRGSDNQPTRDPRSLLQILSRDPSIRFSANGRKMLDWLYTHMADLNGWQNLVHEVPAHSAYLLVEMARGCANEWTGFAEHLEQHLIALEEK